MHLQLIQTKFWEDINLSLHPSGSHSTQNYKEAFFAQRYVLCTFCFLNICISILFFESLPVPAALKNTHTHPRFSLCYWLWEYSGTRGPGPCAGSGFQKTDLCVRWESWIRCAGHGNVNTHSVNVKSGCRTLKKKKAYRWNISAFHVYGTSQYFVEGTRLGNVATVRKHLMPWIPSSGGAGMVWLKVDLSR